MQIAIARCFAVIHYIVIWLMVLVLAPKTKKHAGACFLIKGQLCHRPRLKDQLYLVPSLLLSYFDNNPRLRSSGSMPAALPRNCR